MSEGFHPPPPESESLPALKLTLVGLAALALFAVASFIAWRMTRAVGPVAPTPSILGTREIGIVEQRPFPLRRDAQVNAQRDREWLSHYGWSDRRQLQAHIPIDVATDELIRGQPPQPGASP